MKKLIVSTILATSIVSSGYSFAQDAEEADVDEPAIEATEDADQEARQDTRFKREPIDQAQYSGLDDLKAADADGDGTLTREELEDHALKQLVKRRADRMERRLDINGDGTVTIAEVEKQKQKEFAALDRNEDGKLDRHEMRAGHKFGRHGRHGGHGFHQYRR